MYIGAVVGATCNCINSIGEGNAEVFCQDYQLQEGSSGVASAAVVGRVQCNNELPPYYTEYYRNCTALGTANVGVVPSGNIGFVTRCLYYSF